MPKDKFIRVSKETHQKLSEIGKIGESYDDVINRLLEDSLTWSKFKEKFVTEILYEADISPEKTWTTQDLAEYFKTFFGELQVEKMKKDYLKGFPRIKEKREG